MDQRSTDSVAPGYGTHQGAPVLGGPQAYGGPGFGPEAAPAPASSNSLLSVVWRRKIILLFFLMCGLAGGHYYYTTQPETFASGALVELFREVANVNSDSALSTGSVLEQVQLVVPSASYIEAEIKSDAVLAKAVEIGQLPDFESVPDDPGAAAGMLSRGLSIRSSVGGGAGGSDRTIIEVSFSSGDPKLCAAAVNSSVQAYEEYVNGKYRKSLSALESFIKDARDKVIPELDKLEAEYVKFRSEAPLEWSASGEVINPFREEAIRLQESVYLAEAEKQKLGSRLKLIEETSKGQSNATTVLREVQFVLEDVVSVEQLEAAMAEGPDAEVELMTKLLSLRVQADLAKTQYAENHPQRIAIMRELEVTETAWRDIMKAREEGNTPTNELTEKQESLAKSILRSYVSGLRKRLQLIDEELDSLAQRLDEVTVKAQGLATYENQNAAFARRVERYQAMLDTFDEQLEKANLPLLNPGLQVNILRQAGLGYRTGPDMKKWLFQGALAGLLVGGALAFLVDWSERTFRNPDEIVDSLNIPILSHMPLMRLRKRKLKEGENPKLEEIDAAISVVHDPHAPGAESIRSIRTMLLTSTTKQPEYQVIQVTSSMPSDGKSTIAGNLAVSFAGAGKKVLMIDADLRRPTQHKLFAAGTEKGVTDVLNGDVELKDAIQETAIPGLSIMTTGPKPSNPAEALSMPEFGQMIDDLRMEFDVIIVDTPPILAVSDASAVARVVDGVMFVMRIGRNSKPMAKRSVTILRGLHVNLIGVVINAVGDSGYSAAYATAWSNYYGGRPGGEYGYGYYRYGYRYRYGYGYGYGRSYGTDNYRNASRGQRVIVRGRQKINGGEQAGAVSVADEE